MNPGLVLQKIIWKAKLDTNQAIVLLALSDFMGKGKEYAFPSLSTLHKMTKLSRRWVIQTLQQLENAELIARQARPRQKSNIYTPIMANLLALVEPEERSELAEMVNGLHHSDGQMVNGLHQDGERASPQMVNGLHQDGERSAPERPKERPLERSKGTPYQKQGTPSEQDQGRRTDSALTSTIRELVEETDRRLTEGPIPWSSTHGDLAKSLTSLESLLLGIKKERTRYPTPLEFQLAIESEEFDGLRNRSWGWFTARSGAGAQPQLLRLRQELIKIMDQWDDQARRASSATLVGHFTAPSTEALL